MGKQTDDDTLDTVQSRIEKELVVLHDDMTTELNELKEFSHNMADGFTMLLNDIFLVLTCIKLVLEKLNIDVPKEYKDTRHDYI